MDLKKAVRIVLLDNGVMTDTKAIAEIAELVEEKLKTNSKLSVPCWKCGQLLDVPDWQTSGKCFKCGAKWTTSLGPR